MVAYADEPGFGELSESSESQERHNADVFAFLLSHQSPSIPRLTGALVFERKSVVEQDDFSDKRKP